MEEKGILDEVVKEGLSKGTASERPREVNETTWFLGKSIPGRGESMCKGSGGRRKLGLFGGQQEGQCGCRGVIQGRDSGEKRWARRWEKFPEPNLEELTGHSEDLDSTVRVMESHWKVLHKRGSV